MAEENRNFGCSDWFDLAQDAFDTHAEAGQRRRQVLDMADPVTRATRHAFEQDAKAMQRIAHGDELEIGGVGQPMLEPGTGGARFGSLGHRRALPSGLWLSQRRRSSSSRLRSGLRPEAGWAMILAD